MKDKNSAASCPPMGWNSWDCYGAAVTEKEIRQNAEYMAAHLKSHGWEYIVCDIQWYEPLADSSHYRKFADLCMDEWGRLIPAENRFPSAAGGKGFGPLADYVHSLGLKFGIHVMRGIPRQAVFLDTPVKDTSYTARQIARPEAVCCWNSDMYGFDTAAPGAQEYCDSLIRLYAQWGVDYIKIDDICVQYRALNDESGNQYGGPEIELYHRAVMKQDRPIVVSLSPGPAMLSQAAHLAENANMWRITGDLWDDWRDIMEMFRRCKEWAPYKKTGCWPDCDMLPLGHLSIIGCERGLGERRTRLTEAEQRTMITLWCIFGSPLMVGAELTDLDPFTLSLLTNDEVLELQKKGTEARQIIRSPEHIVWKARIENAVYLAVFNIADWTGSFAVPLETAGAGDNVRVKNLWSKEESVCTGDRLCVTLDAHDCRLFRFTAL